MVIQQFFIRRLCAVGLVLSTLGCALSGASNFLTEVAPVGLADSGGIEYAPSTEPGADIGMFNVTTYNIDGFPEIIGGNSNAETEAIAAELEALALDIIVFQEVFTETKHGIYRDQTSTAVYPYRSPHFRGTSVSFGDGLVRYSRFPFNNEDFVRIRWDECSGDLFGYLLGLYGNPDCNTEKGFTLARTEINAELVIDVYNLHNDAGQDEGSIAAKAASMVQLADYINTESAGNVVIVAGDFNLGWSSNEAHRDIIEQFLLDSGLTFACVETTGSLDNCNDEFDFPDHIGYKNNDAYQLTVLSLSHLLTLVDENGKDLSDHKALMAEFAWERL